MKFLLYLNMVAILYSFIPYNTTNVGATKNKQITKQQFVQILNSTREYQRTKNKNVVNKTQIHNLLTTPSYICVHM